ncbi:hypothetical protein H2136_00305 [Aeromonas hydrophila]|uniref:Uncharacterized protein n=1 Tax=Aeromonas hydrophila TaxID=644 RepID=A0A926IXW7_AERHY|nr:hypothetical protein [Aeromonas hydrophila]
MPRFTLEADEDALTPDPAERLAGRALPARQRVAFRGGTPAEDGLAHPAAGSLSRTSHGRLPTRQL